MTLDASKEAQRKATLDRTKDMINGYAQRAAEILQELAEYAENDRIRLSAANSILDRAGVVTPQEIKVTATQEEHAIVRTEAEETLKRLQANIEHAQKRKTGTDLEVLMVHESDEDANNS